MTLQIYGINKTDKVKREEEIQTEQVTVTCDFYLLRKSFKFIYVVTFVNANYIEPRHKKHISFLMMNHLPG